MRLRGRRPIWNQCGVDRSVSFTNFRLTRGLILLVVIVCWLCTEAISIDICRQQTSWTVSNQLLQTVSKSGFFATKAWVSCRRFYLCMVSAKIESARGREKPVRSEKRWPHSEQYRTYAVIKWNFPSWIVFIIGTLSTNIIVCLKFTGFWNIQWRSQRYCNKVSHHTEMRQKATIQRDSQARYE